MITRPARGAKELVKESRRAQRSQSAQSIFFEKILLCGLSGLCVHVISSHPLKACATGALSSRCCGTERERAETPMCRLSSSRDAGAQSDRWRARPAAEHC